MSVDDICSIIIVGTISFTFVIAAIIFLIASIRGQW